MNFLLTAFNGRLERPGPATHDNAGVAGQNF
jgi:hypothetical protein